MGRASAFADPEIIKMCQEDFIPVTGDDWYQRRRKDREGEFFRGLAAASGKQGHTLQGIYLFASDGTPLGYKNSGGDPEATKEMMRQALIKFRRLPETKTRPGAVTIEDPGKLDPDYTRIPPEGGLILKSYTRILDLKDGAYCKGTCRVFGGEKAARDHVWITSDEVRALAPAQPQVGFRYGLPPAVADRLIRFHLVDNTRGEPDLWRPEDVRGQRWTLVVTTVAADAIEIRLEGEVLLATHANPQKADRGYEGRLLGFLRYVPSRATFDQFDLTAVGSHWGDQTNSRPARPGRSLLGHSFELASDRPSDRVPPQGIRDLKGYYGQK